MRMIIFYILFFFFIPQSLLLGQGNPEVPIELQVSIYLKILSFDRNIPKRTTDTVVIGLVYDDGNDVSVRNKDEFIKAFNTLSDKTTVYGMKVEVFPFTVNIANSAVKQVHIVYSCSLSIKQLKDLLNLTTELSIPTFGSREEDAKTGTAVSLTIVKKKPKIVINLSAAKKQGADFSSGLLKLAKIIKEK